MNVGQPCIKPDVMQLTKRCWTIDQTRQRTKEVSVILWVDCLGSSVRRCCAAVAALNVVCLCQHAGPGGQSMPMQAEYAYAYAEYAYAEYA